MDKVKKSLVSIMFSCTRNIALAVAGLYLLFLLLCVVQDNWASINASIISFINSFKPLKDFLFAHLGKIFIGWVIISLWLVCVFIKMEENEIKDSTLLNFISFLLFPIGSIMFFMVPFQLGMEWFPINIISCLVSFALFVFSIGLVAVFFSEDIVKKLEIETPLDIEAPEQLELFEKK